jgi:TonB family protein
MSKPFSIFLAAALACAAGVAAETGQDAANRVTDERSGVLPTREGQRLQLNTDSGKVRILTSNTASNEVRYTVRIETDGRDPKAKALLQQFRVTGASTPDGVRITGASPWKNYRGRLAVSFEVRVPRRYDVEVQTGAGTIEAEDLGGRAQLKTRGGNIKAGRIAGSALLDTAGGHIQLVAVEGDLTAVSGGGHIVVEKVNGAATLTTRGGHIKVFSVARAAEMRTDGGNIYVKERVGGKVTAESGGGQIVLAEVAGAVDARTSGGGIKILSVAGPSQLQTAGGSIHLEKIQDSVQASTGSGQIVAWFASTGKKEKVGNSELICGQGDILVYLPRDLAVNIEATIEAAGEHRVEAPELPLKTSWVRSASGPRVLRAEAVLNGGGEVLKLHTVAGNIKLLFAHAGGKVEMLSPQELEDRLRMEMERRRKEELIRKEKGAFANWKDWLEWRTRGFINANEEAQKQRLLQPVVKPKYPPQAKQQGIEGWVWLHIMINEEGRVEDLNVISGHPLLAAAAAEAVRQWRYQPHTLSSGQAVKVASVVKVVFSLK